jgi:hypothetical protein
VQIQEYLQDKKFALTDEFREAALEFIEKDV